MKHVCSECFHPWEGADVNLMLINAAANGHEKCTLALLLARADVNSTNVSNFYTPLTSAAERGQTACLKLLINAGADVNIPDPNGETPLIRAAWNGHEECVELLINSGADVNAIDCHRNSPIMCTAWRGYENCMDMLLRAGADVNAGENENTPLICSAWKGHDRCVQLLIKSGVDVNASWINGNTALMEAAANGHVTCVNMLIKAGARVNIADKDGHHALIHAAEHGHDRCMESLIKAGADVNKLHKDGNTVLIYAIYNKHEACVKLLLDLEADTTKKRKDYDQALIYAAAAGNMEIVKLLISAGPNVNYNNGTTALIEAASEGFDSCVAALLESGANVNTCNEEGYTALISAAYNTAATCLDLLLQSGADVNATDRNGNTALLAVVQNVKIEVQPDLLTSCPIDSCHDHGDKVKANEQNNEECNKNVTEESVNQCVSLLLKSGADVKCINNEGQSALSLAVINQWHHVVHVLAQKQALVNNVQHIFHKHSTLSYSGPCCDVSCLSTMLSAGAYVNTYNKHSKSSLIYAAEAGNSECASVLLKSGADVNIADWNGKTALIAAAEANSIECIQIFLQSGAHVNKCTKMGLNALKTCIFNIYGDNKELAMLLFAAGDKLDESIVWVNYPCPGKEVDVRTNAGVLKVVDYCHDRHVEVDVPQYLRELQSLTGLKHMCRESIRKHMMTVNESINLFKTVPRLKFSSSIDPDIQDQLQSYLLYGQTLTVDCAVDAKTAVHKTNCSEKRRSGITHKDDNVRTTEGKEKRITRRKVTESETETSVEQMIMDVKLTKSCCHDNDTAPTKCDKEIKMMKTCHDADNNALTGNNDSVQVEVEKKEKEEDITDFRKSTDKRKSDDYGHDQAGRKEVKDTTDFRKSTIENKRVDSVLYEAENKDKEEDTIDFRKSTTESKGDDSVHVEVGKEEVKDTTDFKKSTAVDNSMEKKQTGAEWDRGKNHTKDEGNERSIEDSDSEKREGSSVISTTTESLPPETKRIKDRGTDITEEYKDMKKCKGTNITEEYKDMKKEVGSLGHSGSARNVRSGVGQQCKKSQMLSTHEFPALPEPKSKVRSLSVSKEETIHTDEVNAPAKQKNGTADKVQLFYQHFFGKEQEKRQDDWKGQVNREGFSGDGHVSMDIRKDIGKDLRIAMKGSRIINVKKEWGGGNATDKEVKAVKQDDENKEKPKEQRKDRNKRRRKDGQENDRLNDDVKDVEHGDDTRNKSSDVNEPEDVGLTESSCDGETKKEAEGQKWMENDDQENSGLNVKKTRPSYAEKIKGRNESMNKEFRDKESQDGEGIKNKCAKEISKNKKEDDSKSEDNDIKTENCKGKKSLNTRKQKDRRRKFPAETENSQLRGQSVSEVDSLGHSGSARNVRSGFKQLCEKSQMLSLDEFPALPESKGKARLQTTKEETIPANEVKTPAIQKNDTDGPYEEMTYDMMFPDLPGPGRGRGKGYSESSGSCMWPGHMPQEVNFYPDGSEFCLPSRGLTCLESTPQIPIGKVMGFEKKPRDSQESTQETNRPRASVKADTVQKNLHYKDVESLWKTVMASKQTSTVRSKDGNDFLDEIDDVDDFAGDTYVKSETKEKQKKQEINKAAKQQKKRRNCDNKGKADDKSDNNRKIKTENKMKKERIMDKRKKYVVNEEVKKFGQPSEKTKYFSKKKENYEFHKNEKVKEQNERAERFEEEEDDDNNDDECDENSDDIVTNNNDKYVEDFEKSQKVEDDETTVDDDDDDKNENDRKLEMIMKNIRKRDSFRNKKGMTKVSHNTDTMSEPCKPMTIVATVMLILSAVFFWAFNETLFWRQYSY